mgnify:CR=1 FL=1
MRKREAIRRSLIRVAKRDLSKGWNEWLEFWQDALQRKRSMGASMGRSGKTGAGSIVLGSSFSLDQVHAAVALRVEG